MGGSSLAPLVLADAFDVVSFHVLDTTHPQAIRALESELDLERTLFVAASKSGTTTETLSHLAYFAQRAGDPTHIAVITDPGSPLEQRAKDEGFGGIFYGEPTVGGRYSALSPFGIVPAALMGIDLDRLLGRAEEMREACEGPDGPGVKLGLALGEGWEQGRDKVCIETDGLFGLWVEQLIAESTGKHGKGLVPAPGEPPDGPGRQAARVELADPYDLGAEFFRWEFATAVAGAIMEINPFDQPDVQAAKDRTREILESGEEPSVEPEGSVEELLASARQGDYVAIQAFVDPARQAELQPLLRRARATGCVVTVGLGPRYLHSTGQLHKGGPDSVIAIQVVDDTGEELPIPGRSTGSAG